MTRHAIPAEVLAQHTAVLGKTGSGDQPEYKKNPKRILCVRACAHCQTEFLVAKKYPGQRFCSRKCGFKELNPSDHNARVARATAKQRGDKLRGRGEGKSYPKLNGRHAHRVIAEQKLGRPLEPGEIVHHRDENKLNYSADNLDILSGQSEHNRVHENFKDARKRGRKPGKVIEFEGRRQNMIAWARDFGVSASTLSYRLRNGWTFEMALRGSRHSKSQGA